MENLASPNRKKLPEEAALVMRAGVYSLSRRSRCSPVGPPVTAEQAVESPEQTRPEAEFVLVRCRLRIRVTRSCACIWVLLFWMLGLLREEGWGSAKVADRADRG